MGSASPAVRRVGPTLLQLSDPKYAESLSKKCQVTGRVCFCVLRTCMYVFSHMQVCPAEVFAPFSVAVSKHFER